MDGCIPANLEKEKSKCYLQCIFHQQRFPFGYCFFELGASSDKKVVDLIDFNIDDASISNILIASIHEVDGSRKERRVLL